jgi:hypothetical protein
LIEQPVAKKRTKSVSSASGKKNAKIQPPNFGDIDLEKVFEILDSEKKGFLTIQDILRVVKEVELEDQFSSEDVQEMLSEADARGDKDSRVNLDDFRNMMNIAFNAKSTTKRKKTN